VCGACLPEYSLDGDLCVLGPVVPRPQRPGDLLVTEYLADGENDAVTFFERNEFVEFYNPGLVDLELRGCEVRGNNSQETFVIQDSAIIRAGGYGIIARADREFAVNADVPVLSHPSISGFVLSNSSGAERAEIWCPDGTAKVRICAVENMVPHEGGVARQVPPSEFPPENPLIGISLCNTPDTVPAFTLRGERGTPGAANVECIRVECPEIETTETEARTTSIIAAFGPNGRSTGTQIVFACTDGYVVSPNTSSVTTRTVTCGDSGTWNTSPPTCVRRACVPLPSLNNVTGPAVYQRPAGEVNAVFGTVASWQCLPGYTLDGTPGGATQGSATCLSTGSWTSVRSCQLVN
jgi:hypothetical protein